MLSLILLVLAVVFLVLGFAGVLGLALAAAVAVGCLVAAVVLREGGGRGWLPTLLTVAVTALLWVAPGLAAPPPAIDPGGGNTCTAGQYWQHSYPTGIWVAVPTQGGTNYEYRQWYHIVGCYDGYSYSTYELR